jgi:hypothetical protein
VLYCTVQCGPGVCFVGFRANGLTIKTHSCTFAVVNMLHNIIDINVYCYIIVISYIQILSEFNLMVTILNFRIAAICNYWLINNVRA